MPSPVTQIEEDIFQVALPLPFALRIVNAYLLRGVTGWTVVDAGLNTSLARQTWLAAFAELNISPQQIEQIVLTHVHPDHYGLAGWLQTLCARDDGSVPPVKLSPSEYEVIGLIWKRIEQWGEESRLFWQQCAVPTPSIEAIIDATLNTGGRTAPHPTRFELIEPGTAVRLGNRCFETYCLPGHSDGQLLFYHRPSQLLLCGDHVLAQITPNISRWPYGIADPLGAYLASFDALRALRVKKALPGHRAILTDLNGRLSFIEAHHAARLDQILAAVSTPQTVYQTSNVLFRHDQLTSHEIRFAVAESLAHLEYWRIRGKLERSGREQWMYRPASTGEPNAGK